MNITVISDKITDISSDIIVAGFFRDSLPIADAAGEIDWLYSGVLSKMIVSRKVVGNPGDSLLLATQNKLPTPKVLFVGMGTKKEFSYSTVKQLTIDVFGILKYMDIKNFVIDFLGAAANLLDHTQAAEAFLSGLPRYATKDEEHIYRLALLVKAREKAVEIDRNIKIHSRF